MVTKIQKWGNSLALRIPKAFAEEADVGPGSRVELSVDADGRLIVKALAQTYDLQDLLSRVTGENLHGEVDSGEAQGREAW